MSVVGSVPGADRALKERARAVWASGDYPSVAREVIADLGRELVDAAGVGPGERVLDLAAGSGNAAVRAAARGASVVAADLTPELFDAGRRWAAEEGVRVEWVEADAEALPFADAAFDVVLSCVGVAFAPHHERAAAELLRVCRPGGRIALAAWTPEGFVGRVFGVLAPFAPAPPAGVQPPALWGREEHVLELLGEHVAEVRLQRLPLRVERFADPAAFREFFTERYGPVRAVRSALAPQRAAELDQRLEELAASAALGGAGFAMEWEHLLLTARRV
ncbi:class I SAM-dependent methyltransferase [Kineococcus indalonis]|uniref:class I SAM-dependent methyltransferase n=1 Tax=Kineococcus indalonis TaxID=2696566 RepID=UPI002B1BD865|nr:methyltransferase domain-containing protein [Kineococcus indalonis]NAZ86428.1 methyltransferase domain-containing protein [Kineococcus indalonis]